MSIHPSSTLSLKSAKAIAELSFTKKGTVSAIAQGSLRYNEIFPFAKAAALLGIQKTASVIPTRQQPAVEDATVKFFIEGLKITIEVEIQAISKRQPDLQALHAASIAALTIIDLLENEDEGIEISALKVDRSKQRDFNLPQHIYEQISATIVVCSDSVYCGQAYDFSGKAIYERLQSMGISSISIENVPDEIPAIQDAAHKAKQTSNLLIFTGGTGLSPRDVTPEAIAPLLTRPIEGIMEAARRYGQDRMPFAMLSRGVAGFIEDTLTMTFPGSKGGVQEYMDALFPAVLHLFQVKKGQRH